MPSRARAAFQLDSLTRAPRSPPQSNPGTGAALLDRREADVSSEDEEHGGMERRGVRDDPAERAPRLSAHPERAAAAAAAGRAEHPREGLADRHDGGQDDEECSGLLEGMGAWIGGSALGADRRKLDSALLRSPGSMPGWGGDWGGGDGSKEHESLDFDTVNTPFWADSSRQQQKRGFMYGVGHAMIRSKRLYQWLFTVAIGVLVALSAKLIQVLIALLISVRNQRMQEYYDAGSSDNNIFVFFAGYNAVLVVSSGVLALCAGSSAAGDGVAEVKAYLNGSHIRGCFNLRAILCKIAGTTLASAAALACGPEGPMIHIGAGIAYAITCIDNLSSVLPALTPSILARFTNDRDRREFIAAGAGAGIAAAFGAPIGGVLFALEEAASHWSPQLIWRIFTSAMVATFTLALIRAGGHSGDISLAGLLSSGTKISLSESKGGVMINPDGSAIVSVMDAPVYVWELVLFLGLGAVGGMLGGVLNASYNLLAPMRPTSRTMRLVEVLFLSLATSYTLFFLAAFTPRCTPNGTWTCRDADNWGDHCAGPADNSTCVGMRAQCVNATGWMCVGGQNNGLACVGRGGFEDCEWRGGSCNALHQSHRFFGMRANCQEGEYHELATLFFGDKSSSIIRMVTQSAPHQDAPFSNQSLIIAAAAYQVLMMAPYGAHARTHTHAHTNTRARAHTHTRQVLMMVTYGAPLAAGFFMPCWLVGAALGRLFGQLVNAHLASQDLVYSGAYALAGAAAMLGGVQRASISLIFFIIEGTSNVHFLLPIVTTLLSANMVSRLFAPEGVLDLALRHHTLRFLPYRPDWLMELCTVGDVMGGPVRTLRAVESIGNIVDLLRSCHHNGFPVVALPPNCENPSQCASTGQPTGGASYASLPVDFEGPQGREGGGAHAVCNAALDEIALGDACGVKGGEPHSGRGRLEGMILRSHLRHILGARFMRDGGTPNSLWQRVTSPPSAWPTSTVRWRYCAGGLGVRGRARERESERVRWRAKLHAFAMF